MKALGYIYIAQCGSFVKIGHSTNPAHRIAGLHTCKMLKPVEVKRRATPLLAMAASKADEKRLHRALAPLRLNGSEWYPDSVLSRSEVTDLPFLPFSDIPKQSRMTINAQVNRDMWREFRAACIGSGISVTEGLEQAIEVWLAHENSK